MAPWSNENIHETLGEKNKELDKLKENLGRAQNEKSTLELSFANAINDIKSNSLTNYSKSLNGIESRLQTMNNKLKSYEDEVSEIIKNINKLDEDSVEISNLSLKKDEIEAQIKSLKEQIQDENINLKILNNDRAVEIERENDNISEQQKLHNISLDNANISIKTLEKEISYLSDEITELNNLLNDTTLYAQIDGIVTDIPVKNGEEVAPNTAIVTLADMQKLRIELNVDQNEIFDIEEGQQVEIILNAFSEKILNGEVINKDLTPNAENGNVVYKVLVNIDLGEDINILEGMTAQATIIKKQVKDV